jgi:transposase
MANIKLGSVVSDLTGKTSRLILQELCYRRADPGELVKLAQGSLKHKQDELAESLNGFADDHFRWLLKDTLHELESLDRKVLQLDRRIADHLRPHQDLVLRLCTIPGVDFTAASIILAEVGFDMSRFPTPEHLASWAGLCPGNNESGGKRFSGRTRDGNRYLRRTLVQSAWSVLRKKDCFLTAVFHRIASRGGMKKAAVAVAHRVILIAWHLIADGGIYQEAGGNYYDRLRPDRTARRLARRLEQIGFQVTLKPVPLVAAATDPPPQADRGHPATTPKPKPADPNVCRRCARWKIPCIHVRNAASRARDTDPQHQPLT